MDVRMPDGTIVKGVPEGTTKDQLAMKMAGRFGFPEIAPQQAAESQGASFYDRLRDGLTDARAVAGEFAAGANRSLVDTLDFVGPDSINAALRLAGAEQQVPTLRGLMEPTGIEGGFMEPGAARDVVQGAGGALPAAAGFTQVPRNLATLTGAAAEFLGAGTAKAPGLIPVAANAVDTKLALLRQTGDLSTAGVMLDEAGNVIKDVAAKATTKQGFDPGLVAMVKASTPEARRKMLAMLDVVEQGKKNFRYSADNRPLDIAGDSVLNRVKVVREANRVAGVKLEGVADSLRGAQVDASPAVNSFLGELEGMGVKFNPQNSTVSFQGSDLEGVPGPQRVIKNVLNRMLNTRVPDAYDVHRLKKFIDEQVTYGKNARGLGGKTERILKTLRHDVDGILDAQFPEYNKVNTQYSETIGALDALQDVAGKKMDFYGENADKAIGTLTRRLLSNAQSRIPLKDAIQQLDTVAQKFAKPGTDVVPYRAVVRRSGVTPDMLDDDIMGQVLFTDELDKVFGAASRTSLLGDVEKGVNTGIDAAMGQKTAAGMVAGGAKWAYDKLRGINEQNAIKAMRELLKRGQ